MSIRHSLRLYLIVRSSLLVQRSNFSRFEVNACKGRFSRAMTTSAVTNERKQPLDALLLNKIDTEQDAFLSKYPQYDGREILIAILDTGVDPSLPGMQVTSAGTRKMVDCIDCTGAGDVETSTIRSVAEGKLEGLSGRILNIPDSWENPTGKYHLGLKPIYELYTKGVRDNISKEKYNDNYYPLHNQAAADALRLLTTHETDVGGTSEKMSDNWDRDDHACKVDFLKTMKNVTDVGPVADVLAWHDGNTWKACIDTSFRGRLNLCKVMGSFKETGEFDFITARDSVVYNFRIAPDGNLVEICVPSGAHGSHVANIAAANYPENPQLNGLAPGAKVISLNIGDIRMAAMETGQAMTRAFNICAEMNVDVINMSFGEGSHLPDEGRVIEEARKLIERKGVIYVCSAGNAGPALSTVGAPGGTTTGVIGIGAYLTAETADTLYGVFNQVESNIYPWSSRGPSCDGKLGVSLVAPAAAFADVPKYCRHSKQMMNGTSMSSPNAAGTIACMLSGIRAQGLQWTPYTVRLALENTAQPLANSDPFSMGQGMIKISSAYDKLLSTLKAETFPNRLLHFNVTVTDLSKTSKGIYIREPVRDKPQEFTVVVKPVFRDQSADNDEQINFERQCILECDADWVQHPKTMLLVGSDRSLVVTVDARKLTPGTANYTEITAFDHAEPSLGPLFRIPVTVISPEVVENVAKGYISKLKGRSGVPERRFIEIPSYVNAVEISLEPGNREPLDRFTLHTVYLEDDKCERNTETCKLFGPVGDTWSKVINVKGGKTLEVCIVRSWARGKDPVDVDLKLAFHGIQKPSEISLIHGSANTPIRIQAPPIRSVEISPKIMLKSIVIPHKPTSAKIEPLGARDVFVVSGLQIHRLLLTYTLKVTKSCEVRLEMAGLTPFLYESPVDCILFQIFNANKAYVSAAGAYPDRYTHKLEKGEYTVQAQIRHPDDGFLEKYRDAPLLVHVKLPSPVDLPIANKPSIAASGKDSKYANKGLMPNQEMTIYVGSLAEDKIPKLINASSGSYLLGEFTVLSGDLKSADKSTVHYWLVEFSSRPSKGLSMVTMKKTPDQNVEMSDAIRDLEVSWITKLKDDAAATQLFESCRQKYNDHLPLLTARIKQLMSKKFSEQTPEALTQVIEISSQILNICDLKEVLQYVAMRPENTDDLLAIEKWAAHTGVEEDTKETAKKLQFLEEKKNAIIIALQALATVELDWKLRTSSRTIPSSIRYGAFTPLIFGGKVEPPAKGKKEVTDSKTKGDALDAAVEAALLKISPVSATADVSTNKVQPKTGLWYMKLLAWLPADDQKNVLVSAKHAALHGHWGRCAKMLNKSAEEVRSGANDSRTVDLGLAEVCDELGWVHLATHFRNTMLVKNRPAYRTFYNIAEMRRILKKKKSLQLIHAPDYPNERCHDEPPKIEGDVIMKKLKRINFSKKYYAELSKGFLKFYASTKKSELQAEYLVDLAKVSLSFSEKRVFIQFRVECRILVPADQSAFDKWKDALIKHRLYRQEMW
ncbi:unnamed protein product [Caenorhabditis auriculariae]|uniref:Tripeptidyl-peptidase 2 n=1 Tax=Caenorhabditis auriculariae TaxID=2777116 RepID=A0A8S1HAA7_9PELO|nr:unnamed protein product [Caenorhabditis auriculariae]